MNMTSLRKARTARRLRKVARGRCTVWRTGVAHGCMALLSKARRQPLATAAAVTVALSLGGLSRCRLPDKQVTSWPAAPRTASGWREYSYGGSGEDIHISTCMLPAITESHRLRLPQ